VQDTGARAGVRVGREQVKGERHGRAREHHL
jgi:hypothetical protein